MKINIAGYDFSVRGPPSTTLESIDFVLDYVDKIAKGRKIALIMASFFGLVSLFLFGSCIPWEVLSKEWIGIFVLLILCPSLIMIYLSIMNLFSSVLLVLLSVLYTFFLLFDPFDIGFTSNLCSISGLLFTIPPLFFIAFNRKRVESYTKMRKHMLCIKGVKALLTICEIIFVTLVTTVVCREIDFTDVYSDNTMGSLVIFLFFFLIPIIIDFCIPFLLKSKDCRSILIAGCLGIVAWPIIATIGWSYLITFMGCIVFCMSVSCLSYMSMGHKFLSIK